MIMMLTGGGGGGGKKCDDEDDDSDGGDDDYRCSDDLRIFIKHKRGFRSHTHVCETRRHNSPCLRLCV